MNKLSTRKERLLYLLETKQLDEVKYAEVLNVSKYHMYRYIKRKPELNNLSYILKAYHLLNKKISLNWFITGMPPFEGYPYFVNGHTKMSLGERVKFLLKKAGLSAKHIEDSFGIKERTFMRRFEALSPNVNDVIFIHLITGFSIDYILEGVGPEYAWKSDTVDLVDLLNEDSK